MAWISVYQEVDGPKLRKLKKALGSSKAEALGLLNFLWFWGMNNADETGMVLEAEIDDITDAFSGTTDIPADKIANALVETGWLDIDEDGRICIHDWDTWQEEWYAAKRRRLHNAEKKRRERAAERAKGMPEEPRPPEGVGEAPTERPPEVGDTLPAAKQAEVPVSNAPPAVPKKKAGKKKEDENPKKKYADYVSMTEDNYNTLVSKYGVLFTQECISKLDYYKGSKKRTYADDYRAILSWVVDECRQKKPQLLKASLEAQNSSNDDNPYSEWGEED